MSRGPELLEAWHRALRVNVNFATPSHLHLFIFDMAVWQYVHILNIHVNAANIDPDGSRTYRLRRA
jgi:hypothetical protein